MQHVYWDYLSDNISGPKYEMEIAMIRIRVHIWRDPGPVPTQCQCQVITSHHQNLNTAPLLLCWHGKYPQTRDSERIIKFNDRLGQVRTQTITAVWPRGLISPHRDQSPWPQYYYSSPAQGSVMVWGPALHRLTFSQSQVWGLPISWRTTRYLINRKQ